MCRHIFYKVVYYVFNTPSACGGELHYPINQDESLYGAACEVLKSEAKFLIIQGDVISFAFKRYSMFCKSLTFFSLIFLVLIRSSMEGM